MAELGAIYTLAETSERLRINPRTICKIARAHGLCARVGRVYLFSEEDIQGIWNALRQRSVSKHSPGVASPFNTSQPGEAYYGLLKLVEAEKKRKAKKRQLRNS